MISEFRSANRGTHLCAGQSLQDSGTVVADGGTLALAPQIFVLRFAAARAALCRRVTMANGKKEEMPFDFEGLLMFQCRIDRTEEPGAS